MGDLLEQGKISDEVAVGIRSGIRLETGIRLREMTVVLVQ
jgi:hypothetical protein